MMPSPPPIVLDPRSAAAFGATMICGLLVLQYAHRRSPFILLWAAGWLLIAPAMLLPARTYPRPWLADAAVGFSQYLGICSAALFVWSADVYRHSRYVSRGQWKLLAAVGVWFAGAPALFGTSLVLVPGYLLVAVLLALAGSMYGAVLLERRMLGAGLIALVLLGLAITSLTMAASLRRIAASSDVALQVFMVNAILAALGAVGIHLLIFEDMTYELRLANRRLEGAREELLHAALTDPLTGCHNRRFLEQVMHRELQRHARFNLPLSLLFIDVDRFKAINDSLGHDVGDRVLRYVAQFLKRNVREADYVFRWGGDEFIVLITCTATEARKKASVLKAKFDAAPETVELPPGVGLSVGWAEVPKGTMDLIPLVNKADERMYQDKGVR
jgi:diguanylate cyclase (GGDEF)-like protein